MKAKKVYEFKRTRKQGLSDKTKLGIEQLYKQQVEEWINQYISKDVIENIYIRDNKTIIKDPLDLLNSSATYIPANFRILYNDMDGNALVIKGSQIEEIGDNIELHGGLNASYSKLKKWPTNLKIISGFAAINTSTVNLFNTPISELPDNLLVNANLDISNTKITQLPENLKVMGDLFLDNTDIDYLPESLYVSKKIITDNINKYNDKTNPEFLDKLKKSNKIILFNNL